jgi:hypothetical protein
MAPGDNIHPAFSHEPSWFSSFGCQVVLGFADSWGNHSGPWARFRRSAGSTDGNGEPGAPFIYVLLTGREALISSELRRSGQVNDPVAIQRLQRLRFGSKGPEVATLQAKLGDTAPDADFGPNTAESLHLKQRSLWRGRSDGIFTPKLAQALGWEVLGPLDAPVG